MEQIRSAKTANRSKNIFIRFERFFSFFGGLVLPVAALLVEAFTGMCGGIFFDPIPTFWHGVLIALTPISYFLINLRLRNGVQIKNLELVLLGLVLAISAVYTVLFIPVMPFAVMYTLFSLFLLFIPAVLTILPFAPLAVFLLSLRQFLALRKSNLFPKTGRLYLTGGVVCGCLMLVGLEIPRTVARVGSEQLVGNPKDLVTLRIMRAVGDRTTLLRACYGEFQRNVSRDFLEWLKLTKFNFTPVNVIRSEDQVSPENMRQVYFRVTGEHFGSQKPPKAVNTSIFRSDSDRGGESVGGVVPEVQLESAVLSGSIDAAAALTYMEWTLKFINIDKDDHEARFEMILPSGGVVSRATLWINGEEKEAAVGGRAETRAAYQSVVRVRRDPLLVTTSAPGRVLVQCYPVPRDGKPMKIKLGITAPVSLATLRSGEVALPAISAKNFTVPSGTMNSIWFDSKADLSSDLGLNVERSETARAVRGEIPFIDHEARHLVINVARTEGTNRGWSEDLDSSNVIHQEILETVMPALRRGVVVIDGSAAMKLFAADLAAGIKNAPLGMELAVIIAGDKPYLLDGTLKELTATSREAYARGVFEYSYGGGADNVEALNEAWELAASNVGATIIWIHSEQPVAFPSFEQFVERYRRRPNGPHVISLPVKPGLNKVMEEAELSRFISEDYRLVESVQKISEVLKDLTSVRVVPLVKRSRGVCDENSCIKEQKTSPHLARLLAYDEIRDAINDGKRKIALEQAERYRLVTPVSGAVVLESREDYVRSGLTPPPDGNEGAQIPGVPEPEEWLLIILSVLMLLIISVANKRWKAASWHAI